MYFNFDIFNHFFLSGGYMSGGGVVFGTGYCPAAICLGVFVLEPFE